jgi:hypothetical protein
VSRNTTTYASGVSYQFDGQMASATFANGLTETYGYSTDGRLQLNSIQAAKQGATPLLALGFSYTGAAGNNGNLQARRSPRWRTLPGTVRCRWRIRSRIPMTE